MRVMSYTKLKFYKYILLSTAGAIKELPLQVVLHDIFKWELTMKQNSIADTVI